MAAQNDSFIKARVVVVDKDGNPDSSKALTCLYNPETVTYNRSSSWQPRPIAQKSKAEHTYQGGGSATLGVMLFLDTTRALTDHGLNVAAGSDVRVQVNFLMSLMDVLEDADDPEKKKRPPYCRFEWDKEYFDKGFLRSCNVTYKLFKPDGTPIRAEAQVSFEIVGLEDGSQNPTTRTEARKTWIVREGERLDWIAYREYGNAAHWRHIAEANGIANPFDLQPGQILRLPPTRR